MYTNIRSAIKDIVAAFDSSKHASAIEAEIEDDFSHMELCTINEQLGRMKRDDIIGEIENGNVTTASELMTEFFLTVRGAL